MVENTIQHSVPTLRRKVWVCFNDRTGPVDEQRIHHKVKIPIRRGRREFSNCQASWYSFCSSNILIKGLPFSGTPALSLALNVMVEVDLSDHVAHRMGNLHWIMQPDAPEWGWLVLMRMVKPWTEWIMILFQKPGWKPPHDGWLPSKEMYEKRIRELIGEDSIPFRVTGVSK